MTSAVILGMIVTMFTRPWDQAKAIGVYSFVAAAGGSLGLLLGGVLTAGAELALDLLRQPADRRRHRHVRHASAAQRQAVSASTREPTCSAAVLLVGSLMLAVYTIVEAGQLGWGSAHTLGLGAVAVALMLGFILRQSQAANPLIPLRIFRNRSVTVANTIQMLFVAGLLGMFFLGSRRVANTPVATPIGRLTKKIQCQFSGCGQHAAEQQSERASGSGDEAVDADRFGLIPGRVNIVTIIPRITAEVIAPPTPWTKRAPISRPWLSATRRASDAPVNSRPERKIRRRPIRSPRRPANSSSPPKAIR